MEHGNSNFAANESTPDAMLPADRRSFVTAALAVVAGGAAVLTPLAAGVATFISPLFKKSKSPLVRVALLDQIPDDGVPRYFPVIAERIDAWNRYPAQRIGAVYLIRKPGEAKPIAFSAKCPHAGCFVGYTPGDDKFQCPCHTSAFKLDGERLRGNAEVAPRGMDPLPVEIRQTASSAGRVGARRGRGTGAPTSGPADSSQAVAEVWVEFIDFQTGHKERIPTT